MVNSETLNEINADNCKKMLIIVKMNVNNCENKCYWLWKWRLKEWQRSTVKLKLMALKGNWTVMRVKTKHCKSENEELDEWKWRNERVVVTLESYWVWVPRKSARAWVKLETFLLQKSLKTYDRHRNEEKKLIRQENVKVFSKKKTQEEL